MCHHRLSCGITVDRLAALAQATQRLRLGTLVTGIHYRHPAVLANMASALDIVSGGRLELGIGAGWNQGSGVVDFWRCDLR